MTSLHSETSVSVTNPIDLVEEIVSANEWAHDRAGDDEIVVEVTGRWCDYRPVCGPYEESRTARKPADRLADLRVLRELT